MLYEDTDRGSSASAADSDACVQCTNKNKQPGCLCLVASAANGGSGRFFELVTALVGGGFGHGHALPNRAPAPVHIWWVVVVGVDLDLGLLFCLLRYRYPLVVGEWPLEGCCGPVGKMGVPWFEVFLNVNSQKRERAPAPLYLCTTRTR